MINLLPQSEKHLLSLKKIKNLIMVLGIVLTVFLIWGGLAWAIHWWLGLGQKSISFKSVFLPLGTAFGPWALSSLLGVLYVLIGQGKFFDFTAGPLLIFPMQASSASLGTAFRHLDLFEIWGMGLAVQFLSISTGLKRKTVLSWAIILWGALILAGSFLRNEF